MSDVTGGRHFIVPSNPTPNGDLHLGHIAGPFLGADVLRRAARQRGEDASILLGTAWQNTHVLMAARRQGRDYLDLAAENADLIEKSLAAAGIEYDVMLRHTDIPGIEQQTRTAFARLREDGTIVLRDGRAHHCPSCDSWRFQGYVDGRCPLCDSPDAYGIDCEGSGRYHDDAELLDARCGVCGTATELRPIRRAYLELESLHGWFEDYFATAALGEPVRAFAEAVLADPLPSMAVTFVSEIGFDAGPELPGQRIYPSFELAPRYAVMAQRLGGARPADTARMSMLFGFDNSFERVFLFPAVLRGHAGSAPQPSVLQMSYFALLDGLKFSTSRKHVVSVHEVIDRYGMDAVRLHLAARRPETGTADITRADLDGSAEVRAVRFLQSWAAGTVPGSPRHPSDVDTERAVSAGADPAGADPASTRPRLVAAASQLDAALQAETLSCRRAADAIVSLAAIAAGSDLTGDARLRADLLHCLVNGAAAVIPETAQELAATFAVEPAPFDGPPGG